MMRGRPRRGRWRVVSAVAARGFILGAAMLLGACTVGPDYVKPSVEVPTTYKEVDGWKVAEPRDQTLRGDWWERFGDPRLSALEPRSTSRASPWRPRRPSSARPTRWFRPPAPATSRRSRWAWG